VFAIAYASKGRLMTDHPIVKTPTAERWLEATLFASRWLMAPFYLGLVVALAILLAVFVGELASEVTHISEMTPESGILLGLSLIDLSLAGNLMLIVIFSGYENFVSRLDAGTREERPVWMGTVDFSGLKLKLVSSIVAISAIALLRSFMKIGDGQLDEGALRWQVIVHLTFVTSGVLLALMDLLSSRARRH
jgi:uncharacterized protein (TIGR00645 family)